MRDGHHASVRATMTTTRVCGWGWFMRITTRLLIDCVDLPRLDGIVVGIHLRVGLIAEPHLVVTV